MSSIANTQAMMGYQPANKRPACRNCKSAVEEFIDRMPPYDTRYLRCDLGGFKTSAGALCDKYIIKVTL
jgi:hypothetical protein